MRQFTLFHNSQLPEYRRPFGAVCSNSSVILKVAVTGGAPEVVVLRLWRDGAGEEKVEMKLAYDEGGTKFYQATILTPAKGGLLWYYFMVLSNGETYYYGNNGNSWGGAGQMTMYPPPSYQITVYKKGFTTPDWFKQAVMYQIFPDRFYNGEDNFQILQPKKGSVLHSNWENDPYYIRDVDTKEIVAYDFFGGNLRGIIAKLPYLQELGITVLYLNPVFMAASNHRYDTGDYHTIDPVLGDNGLFRELCDEARKRGMAVILDGVFSHTGSDSLYFNKYGNYPGQGAYQSPESPYYTWYRFEQYPDKYQCWWGIDTLPNVEETEPSYMDFIIYNKQSVLKYWLQQGIKGWRLDVVDELPERFVKEFYKTLKQTDPEAVLIGEVWEDASHKVSYGKPREYLCGEELDSAMNYPFRTILLNFVLGTTDAPTTGRLLMSLYENYPREHFYSMMNLLGSHDVPRALTILGEAPVGDDMPHIHQARYRLNGEQRTLAVARLKLLALWQMTFPGVPCIYYGDEAGLEGHKDPFNRRTYPWGKEDRELLEWYKTIINLRHEYPVFTTGEWLPVYAGGDVLAYVRRIVNGKDVFDRPQPDATAIVLFNRSKDMTARLSLDVRGICRGRARDAIDGQEYAVVEGTLAVELAPLAGKVLLQVEQPVFPRGCGVLLHPTSLPSKYGIGDLGKEAYEFVNFLHKAKQKMWQILPLNPVGAGESPYQTLSAFAGNWPLISLGKLVADGLLSPADVKVASPFAAGTIEFERVKEFKEGCLRQAFISFCSQPEPQEYRDFVDENANWLPDYALYMALKEHFDGAAWYDWPPSLAGRERQTLAEYGDRLKKKIGYHYFVQYIFFSQWLALKRYAGQWGIQIIGDMPIFVAFDSADVWAHPQLFELDENNRPLKVAGVPPDYFSETGQLWGNPHYRWAAMKEDGYRWWCERFSVLLKLVDIVRIDHFRGFEAYWEIDAGEETAVNGRWVQGPGAAFFQTLQAALGKLPVIAEDLGMITPAVEDLRDMFYFPGMNVLQFSLSCDAGGTMLPFVCGKNTVVYTGTHDNDTTMGWYLANKRKDSVKAIAIQQLLDTDGSDPAEVCWRFIGFAYGSNANTVIVPLQDILCLDSAARMNVPGTVGGNWQWRFLKDSLTPELAAKLAVLVRRYQR